jgi:hypothetical protein
MYGAAYLSHTQLNEYLAFLLDNDLISRQQKTKQSSPRSFIMTERAYKE